MELYPFDEKSQIQVSLEHLEDYMRIEAYIGFTDHFHPVDAASSDWLKAHFQGAQASVLKSGTVRQIEIKDLETGDDLQAIFHIPFSNIKVLLVNDALRADLKKQGFTRFIVHKPKQKRLSQRADTGKQIEKNQRFIESIEGNIKTRDEATSAIENLMDNARVGKVRAKDVQHYVNEIVQGSSEETISAISSLKQSDQTYAHCIDVGAIFQTVYYKIKEDDASPIPFKDQKESLLAAFMHDFGKAKIPKEILDSNVRFEPDSKEMKMMRAHPAFSAKLLTAMGMPDYIVNMAHYHHVKIDQTLFSSYPKNIPFEKLNMEARLIAIIDVYQALTGRRSYKKSWTQKAAIEHLEALAGKEFDANLLQAFKFALGAYPVGSLVELNDGSLAFVIETSELSMDRPKLALMKNPQGIDYLKNPYLDLEVEQDIHIVNDFDQFEIYGENALDVFQKIQLVQN